MKWHHGGNGLEEWRHAVQCTYCTKYMLDYNIHVWLWDIILHSYGFKSVFLSLKVDGAQTQNDMT